jgi:EAL domain-containing protein (putative c-di-GMP-specific phosphodiesterase class I)
VNPARLKLELTESLVLEDVEDTISKMQAIRRYGVKFAMDDFGTGHSSLSYLAQLPLDQLKIDRSFVLNLPGKRNDETIARAIITMGAGMDMEVIAEGVETQAQYAFLQLHGCHAFQGFLFSRPLPLEDFMKFVQCI